ncbi:MAG: aminotransferase class V-fold PLP-dependent enzyme [Candidatus Eremiobacteraeota bacterium]|nr:aminotransferase class V-fold PLP-dependent enzyme [Candidatus Eremiobacteraeota bacterium]
MARIYLDHAATTTVRPEVVEAMAPFLGGGYNASSLHAEGRAARAAVDAARETVARIVGAVPREIVFTGGGTEADVLAVVGAARAQASRGRHIVTTAVEHHAVLRAADLLEREGWRVTRLPVDQRGLVDPDAFAAALTLETSIASVILANNEIGVIEPVAELAAVAHARRVVFHTDAVQAAGWLPLDVDALGVDLLSLSAHKFYGPKGVGALYVRTGTPVEPLIVGGGQEHGLRAGTENVAGIVGFATALALAEAERPATAARVEALRDRLEAGILAAIPGVVVNGAGAPRLPGILSVAFAGAPSDALLIRLDLDGIAASAGSACAAGSLEPSHVIAALGLGEDYRGGVIRFSLGRATTGAEVEEVLNRLPPVLAAIRTPSTV